MLVCLFCFSTVDLSFIIYLSGFAKGTSRIFQQQSHLWLVRYSTIFFLLRCFQYKKPLTSCSTQTNKQTNMCLYVTPHVLYNPSKSTAYEHSRCSLAYQNRFSGYYTKDKSQVITSAVVAFLLTLFFWPSKAFCILYHAISVQPDG